jgi:hypothetical protein
LEFFGLKIPPIKKTCTGLFGILDISSSVKKLYLKVIDSRINLFSVKVLEFELLFTWVVQHLMEIFHFILDWNGEFVGEQFLGVFYQDKGNLMEAEAKLSKKLLHSITIFVDV